VLTFTSLHHMKAFQSWVRSQRILDPFRFRKVCRECMNVEQEGK
jgi:hypothetical protein